MKMTEEQYENFGDKNMGYCTHCDGITTLGVYPDETDKTCTKCSNQTCMGVEEARTYSHIEIDEESDEVGIISFSDDDDYEDSNDE